ncbi:MAG: AAA family ATPase [Thermoplasmata archaeon]|nr:AAA family ATPase [Thermoplasmata archaeon]
MNSRSPKRTVVAIGGLPGSGTTTAAVLLSKKINLPWINGGKLFRELARKKGMTLGEFGRHAEDDPEVDRELDRRLIEIMKNGGIIVEGRLAGANARNHRIPALRVWLHAPFDTRVERIRKRDGGGLDELRAEIRERERSEKKRYMAYYNIDPENLDHYTLVLNSGELRPAQIVHIIIEALRSTGMI